MIFEPNFKILSSYHPMKWMIDDKERKCVLCDEKVRGPKGASCYSCSPWVDSVLGSSGIANKELSKSFQWLKEIVTGTEAVRFTNDGIKVIGSSSQLYEVLPDFEGHGYNIKLRDRGMNWEDCGICLVADCDELPFGDELVALVLALHNDILVAKDVPLLGMVLPSSRIKCKKCDRILVGRDDNLRDGVATQSRGDSSLCKTCNAIRSD